MKQFYTNAFLRGNKIYLRGRYDNGIRFSDEIKYQPYLFIPGKGKYTTIYGDSLIRKNFKNIKEAREFIELYEQNTNVKLYGLTNFVYTFLNDEYPEIDYDPSLISIVSLDIEVSSRNGMPNVDQANEEITAITLTRAGKTITLGTKVYRGQHPYIFCQNEREMLERFLKLWDKDKFWSPDVVTGWSVDMFDIPYLINRTRRICGETMVQTFSPLRVVSERMMVRGKSATNSFKDISDRSEKVYEIAGIAVLDYLQLYKKFSAHASESYRLDYIASVELGKGKHDYCVSPDTRILTSDMQHITANMITPGMELVGFDVNCNGKKNRKLRLTKVLAVKRLKQPCYFIRTNKGGFISSSLHTWLAKKNKKEYKWIKTEDLKIGYKIPRLCEVWNNPDDYEAGWMAGILDGEGWRIRQLIGIGQKEGIVLEQVRKWLSFHGFEWKENFNKNGCIQLWVKGGTSETWRLLGITRPKRLLEKNHQLIDGKNFFGKNSENDVIKDITFLGEQDVIAIQTEHETIIANGLLSHNSDVGTLDDLYDKDFDRYIDYNVQDAVLVEELERKKRYLQIVFSIAYKAKINYTDTMTTSRPWDAILHSYLLKRNIAIPQRKDPGKDVAFVGAYVKDPKPGLHEWVVNFDFDALYPNILSQHNISPETFLEKVEMPSIETLVEHFNPEPEGCFGDKIKPDSTPGQNYAVTANGCLFRKDKRGFIPAIVDEFIQERINVKKEMLQLKKDDPKNLRIEGLDNYQQALKILTNGLYGSLGQKYFRWFDLDLAEAVTTTGQVATRYIEKKCNEYLNRILETDGRDYVVAADTDSVYLKVGALVKACGLAGKPTGSIIEFIDKVCRTKLQPYIERCCMEFGDVFNVYELRLKMKREMIADKAIWRKAKHYIMNVWDKEGVRYKEPELVLHGIEAVRSSTPLVCRDNIKTCLKIIMNQKEADLQNFFQEFYDEFVNMPFTKVAFPRSVNVFDDYYDPVTIYREKTPMHVRGALTYNYLLDKLELGNKYPKIREKDKIRFAYLKEPNITRGNVIAAPDELPPEFELDEYIDFEMQWQKAFVEPIKSITDVIKWTLVKKNTLPGF